MKQVNKLLIGVASLVLFVLAWDRFALLINKPYIPRPCLVFKAILSLLIEKERDYIGFYISQHIAASLMRVFYGFAIAFMLALPLGLFTGWSWYVESAVSPLIEILRPIPPIAWIPFAIIAFREPLDAVFIVFLGNFFPIFVSTVAGVKSIDPPLVEAAKTLGAKRSDLFFKIVVPASVPSVMTGVRIGIGVGWMSVIAAEMVGVKGGGLGLFTLNMHEVGRFDNMFAGMLLIGVIGYLMISGIVYLERRISKWMGMA